MKINLRSERWEMLTKFWFSKVKARKLLSREWEDIIKTYVKRSIVREEVTCSQLPLDRTSGRLLRTRQSVMKGDKFLEEPNNYQFFRKNFAPLELNM
jgi:hypothetical protein